MGKKSKWRKVCNVDKTSSCFSYKHRSKIYESKEQILVTCNPCGLNRTLTFSRMIEPNPVCGCYELR